MGGVDEEEGVEDGGGRAAGVVILNGLVPTGATSGTSECPVPAPGLDEDEAAPIPSGSAPCSISFHIGRFNCFACR